jgi:hypothetical protein
MPKAQPQPEGQKSEKVPQDQESRIFWEVDQEGEKRPQAR